jgi:hypothetical protein
MLSRHDSDEIRYLEREAWEFERSRWGEADTADDPPADGPAAEPAPLLTPDDEIPF